MVKMIFNIIKRIRKLEKWSHPPIVSPDKINELELSISKNTEEIAKLKRSIPKPLKK